MTENGEKSIKRMIIHSFVVVPFIIAVSCALLYAAIRLLTQESQTAYDLLEDVKVGGATKRWQSAFELSRMLAHPDLIPKEEHFVHEMTSAFRKTKEDDRRVRQYLALAMGRTGNRAFLGPLTEELAEEKEENLPAVIYAIGMLRDHRGADALHPFLKHSNPRVRSIAAVAIGNIGRPSSIDKLKEALYDSEPNVQWGAAVSLAKMGNASGKQIIANLLDREYLSSFPAIDSQEQNQLILSAIEAASLLNESELDAKLKQLAAEDQNMKIRTFAQDKLK